MGEELKPCPFCGLSPVAHKDKIDGLWTIYCDNVDCLTEAVTSRQFTQDEAVTIWNTRPLEDALRAEVEQLRAEVQAYKDNPFKAISEMGYHDVEDYYKPDPCENGHTFMWAMNTTTIDRNVPDEVRCQMCNRTLAEIKAALDATGERS